MGHHLFLYRPTLSPPRPGGQIAHGNDGYAWAKSVLALNQRGTYNSHEVPGEKDFPMKKNLRRFVLLGVCLLFFLVTRADAQADRRFLAAEKGAAGAGSRVALLIGNASYLNVSPLSNPPNDVRAFAEALRKVGFDVMVRQDADLRTMDEAVNDFWNRLKGKDSGLFYYSGHGIQVNGQNFLVPVNALIEKELDIKHTCFPAQKLIDLMDDAKAGTNIVILDACRNNPFKRSDRSASMGLAKMDAAGQMFIAYATDPDRVANDGAHGGNSPYMRHILKNLQTPGLPVEMMFKQVRMGVLEDTSQKQRPWELSCLTREFSFAPAGAPTSTVVNAEPPKPVPIEPVEPVEPAEPASPVVVPPSSSGLPALPGWKSAVIQDKDGYTNVRSVANKSGAVVAKIVNGELFYVSPDNKEWWQVRTKNGVVGFMHKSSVLIFK